MICRECPYWIESRDYDNCDCGNCMLYDNIESYKDDVCKADED